MKKDKKQLLNEELSKFNKLLNYDYYDGKGSVNEMNIHGLSKSTDKSEKLLFSGSKTMEEAEEEETDQAIPEAPVDEPAAEDMPDPSLETGAPIPDMNPDANADAELPVDDTMPPAEDEMAPEATDDESVDLDVTELVKGSQEAKASADEANAKIERLLGMVDKLEGQLSSMGQISAKIDGLEKELEKRVPTPDEKIELRSMDSYPYNIKLSDFWADRKDSPYDAGQNDDEDKDEEGNYVLTQDDVDNFDANNIKQSFKENPFEEEDV